MLVKNWMSKEVISIDVNDSIDECHPKVKDAWHTDAAGNETG